MSGDVPVPESLVIMKDVAFAKAGAEAKSPLHAVNKILSFEDDPVLWAFATDERLLERVRELVGPVLKTLSTNLFNKPPGVDGRHPLHQDLRYFALRPADESWEPGRPSNPAGERTDASRSFRGAITGNSPSLTWIRLRRRRSPALFVP